MRELSERARALLEGRHFAVLATFNEDGSIQQSAMWYLLEKHNSTDLVVMNTKQGRVKERNMRRNPRVSLCVVNAYQYVTIVGDVEMIDEPDITQPDIYRLAARYEGHDSASNQMRETFSKEERVTLHLKCDQIFEYFSQ